MKSSFPKSVKHHFQNDKKNGLAIPMPCWIIMFWERALLQNMISEHGIAIATPIFGLALNSFWKRALHINDTYHFM